MTPNPQALTVARAVLLTGEEFFADLVAGAVYKQAELSPLAAVFAEVERRASLSLFDRLLLEAPGRYGAATEAAFAEASAARSASVASVALETATARLATSAGGGGAGVTASTVTRTVVEAGARGLIFGLVIAGVGYAFDRVKAWRLDIALSRGHTAMAATLTAALFELWRELNPKTLPWPQPWPQPKTQPQPEPEEERKKKKDRVKRYVRNQRKRVRAR